MASSDPRSPAIDPAALKSPIADSTKAASLPEAPNATSLGHTTNATSNPSEQSVDSVSNPPDASHGAPNAISTIKVTNSNFQTITKIAPSSDERSVTNVTASNQSERPVESASIPPNVSLGAVQVEQNITPWEVEGAVVDGEVQAIDYNRLIDQFGTRRITPELLERFETVTGHRPHILLRRGMFFSHRDLSSILDKYEKGKPFFLYTGRGPSSDSMHMGHMIPFMFTK